MVGKRATLFWESRAYKTEGARTGSTQSDAEAGLETEGNVKDEEDILAITPARALDEETAYREACARIDRLEGLEEPREPQGSKQEVQTEKTEQREVVEHKDKDTHSNTTTGEGLEEDPLSAEFNTPSQMLNLIHTMSHGANEPDEQTNH